MTMTAPRADEGFRAATCGNRLLASLGPGELALLQPYLRHVELDRGKVLFEPGQDVIQTHFPCEGTVTAIMILTEEGKYIEAATIGREGAIGGIVSHGSRPAFGRGVVQIPGPGLRIATDKLEEAKMRSPKLADLFSRYADYLLAQVMQFAACHAFHTVEQRLCRVLIMAQDRTGDSVLDFTQQALADSLGAQRTTVATTAKSLEDRGIISTRRGRVRIDDRAGLERAACGCYAAIEDHFARLLPTVEALLAT